MKFKAVTFYPIDGKNAEKYFEDLYDAAIYVVENTIGKSDFKVIHDLDKQSSIYFLNTNSAIGIIKPLD